MGTALVTAEWVPNYSMQLTAPRAAADAGR